MKAISVVYDEQLNKYYRIDKNTGEIVPSSKNGDLPRKFKPEYTGKDYQMRKVLF